MIDSNSPRLADRISIVTIVLMPLLLYYDIPGTNLSLITVLKLGLLLVLVFDLLVNKNSKIRQNKAAISYSCLFFWCLFDSIIIFFTANYEVSIFSITYIEFFFTTLLIMLLITKRLSIKLLARTYANIAYVIIAIMGLQVVIYYCFGIGMSFMLPLPLDESYAMIEGTLGVHLNEASGYLNSFASVFSEPSHCALYITPLLAIELTRNKINRALVVSLAMIATTSGNGIICCGIMWLFFAIINEKSTRGKKVIQIFGISLLIATGYLLLNKTDYGKIFSILFVNTTGSSYTKAGFRIYRGFAIFANLPFINKIIGIGYRSITSAYNVLHLDTIFDKANYGMEYTNTIAQIMINFGLVGLSLFCAFFINAYKNCNYCGKMVLISLIAYAFSSSIFNDPIWILYIVYVISSRNAIIGLGT